MARPFTLSVQKLDADDNPTGGIYSFDHIMSFTFDNPSQSYNLIKIPRSNGAIKQAMGKSTRKLRIEGYIEGTDLTTMQAAQKTLEDMFDSRYGNKITRITNSGLTKYYKAVLEKEINWRIVLYTGFFSISMVCPTITEF